MSERVDLENLESRIHDGQAKAWMPEIFAALAELRVARRALRRIGQDLVHNMQGEGLSREAIDLLCEALKLAPEEEKADG